MKPLPERRGFLVFGGGYGSVNASGGTEHSQSARY